MAIYRIILYEIVKKNGVIKNKYMIKNKLQYKVIVYLNKINYNTNFKSIVYIRFTNIDKRFQ